MLAYSSSGPQNAQYKLGFDPLGYFTYHRIQQTGAKRKKYLRRSLFWGAFNLHTGMRGKQTLVDTWLGCQASSARDTGAASSLGDLRHQILVPLGEVMQRMWHSSVDVRVAVHCVRSWSWSIRCSVTWQRQLDGRFCLSNCVGEARKLSQTLQHFSH